jgi:hypothetical protein
MKATTKFISNQSVCNIYKNVLNEFKEDDDVFTLKSFIDNPNTYRNLNILYICIDIYTYIYNLNGAIIEYRAYNLFYDFHPELCKAKC